MPFTTTKSAPVSSGSRIEYLDILRGIAILFIFLINIQYLSGVYYYPDKVADDFSSAKLDRILEVILYVLVNGKFYYIFSILFGIGFAVQFSNIRKSSRNFVPFFTRRMVGLMIFGGLHLVFIWSGDILTLYAIMGLVLIWFRNMNDERLLKLALLMFLLPIFHWLLMYATKTYYYYPLFDFVHERAGELEFTSRESISTGIPRLSHPARIITEDFSQWIKIQVVMPAYRLALIIMKGRIFKVLGLFLVGMWAGRQILQNNLLENKVFLRKVTVWGISIGLPFNILLAIIKFNDFSGNLKNFLDHLFFTLGVTPLAFGFMAGIALIVMNRPKLLKIFAPVGQTALSNYLFQSVISIIIFYGVGLGYYGKFGLSGVLFFALIVFICQIIFSKIWLKYFRFGPLEWLWRQMTYGRWIKNRKR
ncbi:MAG: DUF418 domain-containing protein [Cryomorphaceae bacterium]|nr:DUF418 domain-containing protein [Cryomorphaceae bacterium]